MPKNSSAAHRKAVRQMAADGGISYTAALRRIQAAGGKAAPPESGPIGAGGQLLLRESAADLLEQWQRHPVEVRACQACRHVHLAHYGSPGQQQHGCVACEETAGTCPVFVPGAVPKLSSHVSPVSADPVPCPWLCGHGLDEHADGAGCFRCGCCYGMPGMAAPASITYHGYPADGPGGRLVVIEAPAGNPITLLPRINSAEFAWGYGGTGPRQLARCLLLAALGQAAACTACHGAAKLALSEDGAQIPCGPGIEDNCDPETITACQLCGDGYRDVPHQKFKSQVVANWDQDEEWVLDRAQIIAWLRGAAPDLAAAASAWPGGA